MNEIKEADLIEEIGIAVFNECGENINVELGNKESGRQIIKIYGTSSKEKHQDIISIAERICDQDEEKYTVYNLLETQDGKLSSRHGHVKSIKTGRLVDIKSVTIHSEESPSTPIIDIHESNPYSVKATLLDLQEELNQTQIPFCNSLQLMLRNFEGKAFDTFEQNQEIASIIQEMANRLNCLFQCPKCGEPSRLRCVKAGNARNGIFHFDHKMKTTDGKHRRTTHGGKATIPKLELLPKNANQGLTNEAKD